MLLQYFKKKENEYKKTANKIYISTLTDSKNFIKNNYFNEINFNSSFEVISIILIFYLKIFKDKNEYDHTKVSEELVKNFISDIDKTLRELGIGDMSIGKYVKKHVKKFYYRIKIIDPILDNYDENKFVNFLNSLKYTDKRYTKIMAKDLINIYTNMKKIA